ncbi:hypothetical protein ACFXOS_33380 [Streptomyces sp. NPDC059175]|uniref:hypothetical protein n=1 Tax=Streptomyces sp. NPDC059175 TaxID=3346757 RepID=UPI0036939431
MTGSVQALGKVLPSSTVAGWRDRAAVLVQLSVAIVLGAENLTEAEQLQLHQRPLFGFAASDSTARRTLAALDEATLARIAKARARVRRHVWSLLHLRPGGFPWLTVAGKRLTGWIVIDRDATVITAASKKSGAAVTFKRRSGFIRWPRGARTPPSPWPCCHGRGTLGRTPSPITLPCSPTLSRRSPARQPRSSWSGPTVPGRPTGCWNTSKR